MNRLALLLSAALMTGRAVADGGDQPPSPSPAPSPAYAVNLESRRAVDWLPLRTSISRGLVIDILVNGKPIKAAIDSGLRSEALLFLRSAAAARLGVTSTGHQVTAQTYGGVARETTGVATSVAVGGVSFTNAPVRIEDRSGYGDDVEAVIGADLLKFVTLVIDPGHQRVQLLLPGELAGLKTGGSVLPLKDSLHWEASTVEVRFCSGKTDLALDTGSNGDLDLRATRLERAGCKEAVQSDVQSVTSAGERISHRIGIADATMGSVALGPVLAQDVPDSQADALGIDGGIGLGVLSRFVTAIDLSSRRLAFLGPAPVSEGIERPTIGLQIRRMRNALEVLHVEANSPASRSALTTRDTICAVDGESIATLGDYFNTNPAPGTELTLTTCDGRQVVITAADFLFPAGVGQSARNAFAPTQVGDFTAAVNACIWGDDRGKPASCTTVINAPPETRAIGDLRIPAYLSRAQGEAALGDARRAQEDYRQVLTLDPNNAQARAALSGAGS